jgi:hypothetical protein
LQKLPHQPPKKRDRLPAPSRLSSFSRRHITAPTLKLIMISSCSNIGLCKKRL